MTDKQPEALRLADELLALYGFTEIDERVATELRRLHEVNSELLKIIAASFDLRFGDDASWFEWFSRCEAVIAKAEGK